jgi:hypothetical protein
MAKQPRPLRPEDEGTYAELSTKPNPKGLRIVHIPSLLSWLQRAERQKGSPLSPTEVERVCGMAPAIALQPEQVEAMEAERDYVDIDPRNAWTEWQREREQAD